MSHATVPIEQVTTRSGPRTSSFGDRLRKALSFPALIWTAHFLIVQIAAFLSYRFGTFRSVQYDGMNWSRLVPAVAEDSSAYQVHRPPLTGWEHWLVEPLRNWDGTWYSGIAEQTYNNWRFVKDGISYTASAGAEAAFFPAYPWMMRWMNQLMGIPVETAGWIISNLALFGALVFTYLLVRDDFDETVARWTLVLLAFFPTAFFFSAVYTESLFLFLSVVTLWAARKNDWLLAVLMCLGAVLTRSAGMMLGFPLAVLFIRQHGWNPVRWFPKVLLAVVPLLGVPIFGLILRAHDLGFWDWQKQQWQWNRFSAFPTRTFSCVLNGCEAVVGPTGSQYTATVNAWTLDWLRLLIDHPTFTTLSSTEFRYMFGQSQIMDVVVTVVALVLMAIGLKKLPIYYSAWAIPPMIVPLFAPSSVFPLMSMPRFVLPMVPLFVMVALLVKRWPKLAWSVAMVSALVLMAQTAQFALWYWVS